MARVPMLAGSRVVLVPADDARLLRPPDPLDAIVDVAAAAREALRYPLSGPRLAALASRGGRATVVVDPPSLPVPGARLDPRRDALAAVLGELTREGMRTTILVAGGLEQRAGPHELEALLSPPAARAFRGLVVVHDCERDDLVELGAFEGTPLRIAPEIADADLVVVVSAAESVVHGGPAALLGACGAEAARATTAESLLETRGSRGWQAGLALERLLAERAPLFGLSLVLDLPRFEGRYRDYPHAAGVPERLAASPARVALNMLPGGLRTRILHGMSRELGAVAALGGPPSVAHVEALLRGTALRATTLDEPLDAIVLPLPWKGPHQPREVLNPITAAATALGLALRQWRQRFPVVDGGTAVLLHPFGRTFGDAAGAPYRTLFHTLRESVAPEDVAQAEAAAGSDGRGIAAYRAGRAPHPLLPFADWAACAPALSRLGSVIVAGCRDAGAARALGFVPAHNVQGGLEMAHGLAGEDARVGLLLAPPYAPLVVGP